MSLIAAPAFAQTIDSPTIDMETEIGLDGWIDLSGPVPLRITIGSELLFTGIIEVGSDGPSIIVEAEVPAGGEKTFSLWLSPVTANRVFDIDLVPHNASEPMESITLRPRASGEALLVGTLGVDQVVLLPAETSMGLRGKPVEMIALPDFEADPGPVHYLLFGGGGNLELHHRRWLSSGGSLIAPTSTLAEAGLEDGLTATPAANRFLYGAGEVLTVPGLDLTLDQWSGLLRTTGDAGAFLDPWAAPETQMLQAAGQSNRGGLARPGLLIGLGVYALLVAPVNLLILKRLGRRELAWMTVPAISVLTAIGFWVMGTFSPVDTRFAQATIIIGGEEEHLAHTVLVGVADSKRTHRLAVADNAILYPAATLDSVGMGGGSGRRTIISSNSMTLEFLEPGYVTAGVISPSEGMPRVSLELGGDRPVARIENSAAYDLIAFGVNMGGMTTAGSGTLRSGDDTTLEIRGNVLMAPIDAIFNQLEGVDFNRFWQVFPPLATVASQAVRGDYFYGYVDRLPVTVELDGRQRVIEGPGVVVIPLPRVDIGSASGEIVELEDGTVFDGGQWFEGTSLILSFSVPQDADLQLMRGEQMWGRAPDFLAWDWTASTFVDLPAGDIPSRFVGDDGAVLIQIAGEDDQESFGLMIPSVRIVWDP